jgi:hypothetical protein
MDEAPWTRSFEIEGDPSGRIDLKQIDRKTFELGSTIKYIGQHTGLEGKVGDAALREIRLVSPGRLPTTDLASAPGPVRWFVSTYGVHTPAALIHDWLIAPGPPVVEGVTSEYADRYFRFMLADLGVRWIRRWLMWAAVALRTRYAARGWRRALVVIWGIAALGGIAAFVLGAIRAELWLTALATFAPLGFCLLWGKQYGAGLWASYTAPWVLPPTLIGAIGYGIYWVLEWLVRVLFGGKPGDQPFRYQDF